MVVLCFYSCTKLLQQNPILYQTALVIAFYSIPKLGWMKCKVYVHQIMVEKLDSSGDG